MLLSRTPLDMVAGASHRPKNHPIETPQLSLPPCPMRVYLTKTGGHQAYAKMACRREPGQLQIMWAWCNGLQSHADDCSLSCNESCPGGVDGCSECGPANAVIAVLAGFDCRPLQLQNGCLTWDAAPVLKLGIHPEMERPAILNRSMPAIAGATIRVLPARTIDEAFQRDMPSRGTEIIYIFERRDTRGGAVFPGADVLVLMLYTDCSLLSLKSAPFSCLLPPVPQCGTMLPARLPVRGGRGWDRARQGRRGREETPHPWAAPGECEEVLQMRVHTVLLLSQRCRSLCS